MSFPAILRNGLNPTFQDQHTDESSIIRERARRTKYTLRREGKQWVRRRENSEFYFLLDWYIKRTGQGADGE